MRKETSPNKRFNWRVECADALNVHKDSQNKVQTIWQMFASAASSRQRSTSGLTSQRTRFKRVLGKRLDTVLKVLQKMASKHVEK